MAQKKKEVERLIPIAAIRAGKTYGEVNKMLIDAGFGYMNKSSFQMVKKIYVPYIFGNNKVNQKLRDQIEHPSSVGNLR